MSLTNPFDATPLHDAPMTPSEQRREDKRAEREMFDNEVERAQRAVDAALAGIRTAQGAEHAAYRAAVAARAAEGGYSEVYQTALAAAQAACAAHREARDLHCDLRHELWHAEQNARAAYV